MLLVQPVLSTRSDFSVAVTAVYRSVAAGLEGDFGFLAALGAYRGKHLAWASVAAVTKAF